MEISFGWTAAPFVMRQKFCTRRNWKLIHAEKFHKDREVVAIDTDRRCGGKPIGLIKLTQDAMLESTSCMPDADFKKEGFAFLEKHSYLIKGGNAPFLKHGSMRAFFEWWKKQDEALYTVRFDILEVCPKYIKKIKTITKACEAHIKKYGN